MGAIRSGHAAQTVAAVALLAVGHPAPAQASSMPTADFEASRWHIGLGAVRFALVPIPVPGGSLDYSLTDRLAVGAAASMLSGFARATYRFGEVPGLLQYGVTLSGGYGYEYLPLTRFLVLGPYTFPERSNPQFYYDMGLGGSQAYRGGWGQPALNATLTPFGPEGPILVRAMWGPVFGVATLMGAGPPPGETGAIQLDDVFAVTLVPNIELAFRPWRWLELTIGGYSLAGVRTHF